MVSLIGLGLYTPKESSRLAGVPAQSIYRWLRGYPSKGVDYAPLWRPEIEAEELTLSFRDLIEVRAVEGFRRAGVSAQMIRRAIDLASDLIGTQRPLSTAKFRTDGKSILLQLQPSSGDDVELINIFTKQLNFRSIVEQSLRDVEFEGMFPRLWRPSGVAGGVVLDPSRSFGQPIEESCGLPTRALAEAVESEGSIDAAAKLFEVSKRSVRRALDFERHLAAA